MDEAFMLRKTSPNPSLPGGELHVQQQQWGGKHEFPPSASGGEGSGEGSILNIILPRTFPFIDKSQQGRRTAF
jgi:hypothetical protein